MDQFIESVLHSPNAIWILILASPWLAMLAYIGYTLRNPPKPPPKDLATELKNALISEINAAISALRKTDTAHAHELAEIRERLAAIEGMLRSTTRVKK